MTTAGWADPCRVGACVMSSARLIPGAVAVTSRPAGRAGRPGAGTIRPGPSPGGLTGNGTRCRHDLADHAEREASTPPRACLLYTSDAADD